MGSNRMTRPAREFDLSKLRLRHIRWIGGGSGAGKSTVARRLSERYGLRRYHCDDMQSAHTASSQEMFRTFHGFHGEGFGLILEDLLDLPTAVPVLVEGYKLLPRLVAPLLSRLDQAVWLLPTPSFRRTASLSAWIGSGKCPGM